MARGSTASQGRAARSELSERLRAKAEELRKQNEAEKKEVEDTQQEFNDIVEQERIRIEEELMREMKDRKWSVDDLAQARREAEAKLAEEQAKVEEERERVEKGKKQVILNEWEDMNNKRIKFSSKKENAVLGDYLPYAFAGGQKNAEGKSLNPALYVPWSFAGDYERDMIGKAPASIRPAIEAFFEAHSDDRTGVEEALQKAYEVALTRRIEAYDPSVDEAKVKDVNDIPSQTEHKNALANVAKAEKYIRKILKSAKEKDMRFDKNGNERA